MVVAASQNYGQQKENIPHFNLKAREIEMQPYLRERAIGVLR